MACTGPGYPSDYYTTFKATMHLMHPSYINTNVSGGFSFYYYMWDGYITNGCGWWQQKATQFESQYNSGAYPGQYVNNIWVPNPNPANAYQLLLYTQKYNLCVAMALICCGIQIPPMNINILNPVAPPQNTPIAPPKDTPTILPEEENEDYEV
tara:strand:+ start:61 stop:519 length:459 start_codon:yes stop_codon:yes gene_type:complete